MPENKTSENVIEVAEMSSLKIKYDCGMNREGRTIVKARSFSNVKPKATSLDVYNVAQKLSSLQKHNILSVVKQDNTSLN